MAAPAVLRLRDPSSFSHRALRTASGAALRGAAAVANENLVCKVITLSPAGAFVTLTPADAFVTVTDCR